MSRHENLGKKEIGNEIEKPKGDGADRASTLGKVKEKINQKKEN